MKQLRNSKAQGSALFILVSAIVILLAVVYFFFKLAGSGSFSDVAATTESATQTRIQPSGQLVLGDGIPVGERQGDSIFKKVCIQCHAADSIVPNAPRFENKADWAPRIAQGFDTLFDHALNGYKTMPAKGGASDLTDQELKRVIVYIANHSGANFPDPDAGAAAAPAEGAESASGAAVTADGQKVFEASCVACHGASSAIPGVPRITKNDEWADRIKKGKDVLYKSALEGFNTMPARGGNPNLSDDEVKAAVNYMVNQSGGKF